MMAAAALPAGCSGYHWFDNTYNTQGKNPTPLPSPSVYRYSYPKTAPVLDAAGLQDLVGRYRHQVVLLDFWASWSRQNREELSMLARLQDEMRGEGFQVIACGLDPADKWSVQTVPMLHGAEANFPCVVIDPEARPALRAWLAPQWDYDLPARFVIDRNGQVARAALSGVAIASVEAAVRDLVRGGPDSAVARRASANAPSADPSGGDLEPLSWRGASRPDGRITSAKRDD